MNPTISITVLIIVFVSFISNVKSEKFVKADTIFTSYYRNITARSDISCASVCDKDPVCRSFGYQGPNKECRLSTEYLSPLHQTDTSETQWHVYNKGFQDCGMPTYYLLNGGLPDLDKGTTLVGDTATYTCVYGYRLEPPSAGVRVVCNQSVQWETPNVTCVEGKNGKPCWVDRDCVDNNAICIRADNKDPAGNCFCNHNTTYNKTFQACSDDCMLSEQFIDAMIVPGARIQSYDIGVRRVTNAEECWNYCLSLNGAHSADYVDRPRFIHNKDLCSCKTVTLQQILDGGLYKTELDSGFTLITKTCL